MEASQPGRRVGPDLGEISPHPYFSCKKNFHSYEQAGCPGKWDLDRQLPRSRQPGQTEWHRASYFSICIAHPGIGGIKFFIKINSSTRSTRQSVVMWKFFLQHSWGALGGATPFQTFCHHKSVQPGLYQ